MITFTWKLEILWTNKYNWTNKTIAPRKKDLRDIERNAHKKEN